MKKASNVFSILGIFGNLIAAIYYSCVNPYICWIFLIIFVFTLIFGIAGLAFQEKHIAIGIFMIIFVNLF